MITAGHTWKAETVTFRLFQENLEDELFKIKPLQESKPWNEKKIPMNAKMIDAEIKH